MTGSNRDILIHQVIARLDVGGPAMHVVLLTRELEGRPIPPSTTGAADAEASSSDSGVPTFHARLIAGSVVESEGDMSYLAEERGVEVTRLDAMSRDLSFLDGLRSFFELWRFFRRERPDVVHTHTAKAGALGRVAAALAGVPVRIHTYHGRVPGGDYFSLPKTGSFRGVERALSNLTQRLVVLTDAQREEMSARVAVAGAEKFAVVPPGLELGPFVAGADRAASRPNARDSARSRLELDPDDIVVGIVGRLVPIKNHELLFDALPVLQKRVPRLRILVVGSGEREEALREHARERGIEDDVRWLGWRRDLPEIYPALDVLALPSKDEGTPVAVIEALAARVPVVARHVGGVAEVLEDGKWGRLVRKPGPGEHPEAPPDSAAHGSPESFPDRSSDSGSDTLLEAFADALAATITDPPSPETRAAASRSVLERYGLERLVRDLEEIYRTELERAH